MPRLLSAIWKIICAQPTTLRVAIVCEGCGRRHHLERPIDHAGDVEIVCHDCELPLVAVIEVAQLQRVQPSHTRHGQPRS